MSHIPAKAMPRARHHETDSDSFAPPAKRKKAKDDSSGGSSVALAIGGVLAIGVIAAFVLPGLLNDKPQPKKPKGKHRKPA